MLMTVTDDQTLLYGGMQTWAVFAGKNQLLGDLLCLGGAVLFAVVSVTQELVVKTHDWVEYLGMVGLFGSVISIVQTYVCVRTCMTLAVVSKVEVRSLNVNDQQPVYSVPKCIRLKCSCVENLCFVVMGTYIIDGSCVFTPQGQPKGHAVKVNTVLISK
jgi:Eukaryotic protein of unknown function (DUF914).